MIPIINKQVEELGWNKWQYYYSILWLKF
jgi:hypothetical protein